MRIVLVGLGIIGRRHLANLRTLEPHARITVLRHTAGNSTVPAGADSVVFNLEDALAERPDLAFICVPTALHVAAGLAFVQSGAHLFIEKPLSLDTVAAQTLLEESRYAARIVAVGYNLRFSRSLRAMYDAVREGRIGRVMSGRAEVGQYLPDWRPEADYRTTSSAQAKLGGGVIFELSHEIDYLRWLVGEVGAVQAMAGKLSDLELDTDDTADILLSFRNGALGNIHLDMTQRSAVRQCRLVGTDGTLTWDGISGETRLFRANEGWSVLVRAGSEERNAMYLSQTANVLACVRGDETPVVDGRTGVRVVEIARAAARAAREGRRVSL
jgi:predicted dehydrogenase